MVTGVYEISKRPRVSKDEALEVLVTRFYKRGKISLREGASTLGISKSEFKSLLIEFEIPIRDNKPLDVGFW